MGGKHCRLYDENLVHNIMISTGLSILEYLKQNRTADTDDICEFVEVNAHSIIEDTIDHLNNIEEPEEGERTVGDDTDSWPIEGEGESDSTT